MWVCLTSPVGLSLYKCHLNHKVTDNFNRKFCITILTRVMSHLILTSNTFEIWCGTLLKSGPIFGILSIGPKNVLIEGKTIFVLVGSVFVFGTFYFFKIFILRVCVCACMCICIPILSEYLHMTTHRHTKDSKPSEDPYTGPWKTLAKNAENVMF